MLWLCLLLARLPLDLLERSGLDPALPQAITEGNTQRRWIVATNASAERAGVRPGQSAAAARALAAALHLAPRDPAQEQAALERLATAAYELSAMVSIAPPDVVLLEAGASLALFSGSEALLARVRAICTALGLSARIALAPTPAAAELLARIDAPIGSFAPAELQRALGQIALVHTPLDADTRNGLARVGFTTVGDLARLPRVALARRFHDATVAYLDRLFGHAPDPRPRWLPPPRFDSALELPAPFHALEALLFPLKRLLGELAACLAARDGGAERLQLAFAHEDLPATTIEIGAAEPTRDAARWLELARARLERTTLPAPVVRLRLLVTELPPFVPRGEDLFSPAARAGLPLPRLVERLRARLGERAIAALATRPDHRPEYASRLDPDFALADAPAGYRAARALREAASEAHSDRPCWLLPAPESIDPAQFQMLAGPERIESGWWDELDVARDYYLAARHDGALGWIFHERRAPHGWYLHGWFG